MSSDLTATLKEPSSENSHKGLIVLLGRFLFTLIFLIAGPNLFTKAGIADAASHGIPAAWIAAPLAGLIATIGGISVLLGYRAKLGAWLMVLFLVVVTPTMHRFWGLTDPAIAQIQLIMFLKNVSILGGAFLATQFGAGPWSLDSCRAR